MARKVHSEESKVLGFFATANVDEAKRVLEAAQAILSMRAPIARKPAVKKKAAKAAGDRDPLPF